jgi:23S rRNA (cytosine1962-C5)-methyltransferase
MTRHLPDLPAPPARVVKLKLDRELSSVVRRGHPWVYAGSAPEPKESGPAGSFVTLYDDKNQFLAVGLYDPVGAIRVRVFHRGKPAPLDRAFFTARLTAANELRASLAATDTTGYRVVYGESDGLPGAVLDRYEDTLVLKLYTPAWVPHLTALLDAVDEVLAPGRVVLRFPRTVAARASELAGLADGMTIAGDPPAGPVRFRENGLAFEADVVAGQKTGFFLDQRDNRARVRELARGRATLNVCSHAGGFSVYAAAGGAPAVASLDISERALAGARRSFELNPRLAKVEHELIAGNAFDRLPELARAGRQFGLVIVDPPSFAMREADREGALSSYRALNARAAELVSPGGVLVSCSCSAHVNEEDFEHAVRAGLSRRRHRVLDRTGHALDHPVAFREARYLKAVWLQL